MIHLITFAYQNRAEAFPFDLTPMEIAVHQAFLYSGNSSAPLIDDPRMPPEGTWAGYPSNQTVASYIGRRVEAVENAIKGMVEKGAIERTDNDGGRKSAVTTILSPTARQMRQDVARDRARRLVSDVSEDGLLDVARQAARDGLSVRAFVEATFPAPGRDKKGRTPDEERIGLRLAVEMVLEDLAVDLPGLAPQATTRERDADVVPLPVRQVADITEDVTTAAVVTSYDVDLREQILRGM